jgi:DNA-binding NarL/FixJ family response regulator
MCDLKYSTVLVPANTTSFRSEVQVIRLLIVADGESTAHALSMRLSAEPDLWVVGEVTCCGEALGAVESLLPAIALVDMDILRSYDTASTLQLHALCRMTSVILLTLHEDVCARRCVAGAGTAAFVSKLLPVETLLSTIRDVAQGGIK